MLPKDDRTEGDWYRLPVRRAWWVALWLSLIFGHQSVTFAEPPNGLINPSPLDREVDQAVSKAIRFLVREQQPNGGWRIDQFDGEATSAASLSLMALLAAGHVPGDEPHAATFRRGLKYLLDHQQRSGLIVDRTGHGPLYCHGISTLLLAEIDGLVEAEQASACRAALENAVRALLMAQAVRKPARHAGGWRYTLTTNESDLSVTAWQLLALRAAKNVGCDIPADAIDRAVEYVRRCAPRTAPGFGYQPDTGSSPNMTAAGITALQVCGLPDAPEVKRAVNLLAGRLPRAQDRYYFYGAYYSSVALHQYGQDQWADSKEPLFRELLRGQAPDGSWTPQNDSERGVGRIYATTLAVLALTVEYGYLPIYQK